MLLVLNNVIQDTITDIRNFEVELQFDIKKEGYLGETTDRRDETFHGVSGKMDLHFENPDVFNLMQSIADRARRRAPGTKINIKAGLNFPSGERKRIQINDAFFGNIPVNFPSRSEYGAITLTFEAQDVSFI